MILRPFLLEETACASYLFGCTSQGKLAVADPHVDLVERYLEAAERAGGEIVAVFETHVQVEHGNTVVRAISTPGHAPAHNAYLVVDRRRDAEDPWLVFTGDSLLVNDAGRPDLHAKGEPLPLAKSQFDSMRRLLALPDYVLVYPTHFGGSVCGRGLSGNPFSTIGFERRHNRALAYDDAESFARALLVDVPPPPAGQAAIVAANRSGLAP